MYKATSSRRAPGHSYDQKKLFLNFLELLLDLKILRIAPRESGASVWSAVSACTLQIYFLNVARSEYLLNHASETPAAP